MVATGVPSICRLKPRFHPKPGTLFTTTRPSAGLACATLLVEIAHAQATIRRALLPKLRLDLMADIRIRRIFLQRRMWTNSRIFNRYRKTTVVIPKDTMRSLARMLAARRCRREKCCAQLFECWLPISETGSEVANCISHRHSIATYARCARALCSAARHGS